MFIPTIEEVFLGVDRIYCERNDAGNLKLFSKSELWNKNHLPYLPIYEYFPKEPAALDGLFMDFVHLTVEGSDLYARAVSEGLRQRWPELRQDLGVSGAVDLPFSTEEADSNH